MAIRGMDLVATELSLGAKARELYSVLYIEDSAQYKVVNTAILKVYEFVLESYRQKFQNTVKSDNQAHVEFARQNQILCDRWCTSKEINDNFEKLHQMILVEEFKNCVSCEVKTYLDEKKAETLKEAAVLAADHVLTHNGMLRQQTLSSSLFSQLNHRAQPFYPSNYG